MSDQLMREAAIRSETPPPGSPDCGDAHNQPIRFGQFLALPASRTLLRMGAPVDLGGRAFDLLIVLLRSRGRLVTRDEIVRYVWPSTIVDESNLRFQMACLRKALGEARDLIKTVPGRGYLFIDDRAERYGVARSVVISTPRLGPRRDEKPIIFVIDKDDVIRDALNRLLGSFDVSVSSYASIDALLESTTETLRDDVRPKSTRQWLRAG